MKPEEVPQELVDILDEAAGKKHSDTGVVRSALAEILTRHGVMVLESLERELEELEAMHIQNHIAKTGVVHDHTGKHWPCGCDPTLVGLLQAAEETGNIDVRFGNQNE